MARSLIDDRSVVPVFELPGRGGVLFDAADYKRKKNLVIFILTHPTVPFLTALDEACARIREKNAVVVIISPCDPVIMENIHQAYRLTYPFLCDPSRSVISRFVSASSEEKVAASFVTDRNGELFFQTVATEIVELPSFDDIIKSLEFIESQCPECQ